MCNKLILYMSVLGNTNNLTKIEDDQYAYSYQNIDKYVYATQTNEAATKCFMKVLKQKKQYIKEIIIIGTKEVLENNIKNHEITTKQYYEYSIRKWCNENDVTCPVFLYVKTYENNSDKSIAEILTGITDRLDDDDDIYIDSTGGFRDSAYILLLLSRIMEYTMRHTKMILYSQLNRDKSRGNTIVDATYIYRMFDLISGVNEFSSYGSSDMLYKYFKDFNNNDVTEFINQMVDFQESIKLCKTDKLENNFSLLKKSIDKIESVRTDDENVLLLSRLVPFIRRKFFMDESETLSILNIIRWCVNNGLMQQALTIYVEKIPKFLNDVGIITTSKELYEKYNKTTQKYEDVDAKILYCDLMVRDKNYNVLQSLNEAMDNIQINNFSDNAFSEYQNTGIREAVRRLYTIKKLWRDNISKSNYRDCFKQTDYYTRVSVEQLMNNKNFSANFISSYNNIKNNDYIKKTLLGCNMYNEPRNKVDIKIMCIQQFDSKKYTDFKIGVSNDDFRKLMYDYLYIKIVRNQINHASDNDNFNKSQKDYFEKMGYCANEFTTTGICGVLDRSIHMLSNIIKNQSVN